MSGVRNVSFDEASFYRDFTTTKVKPKGKGTKNFYFDDGKNIITLSFHELVSGVDIYKDFLLANKRERLTLLRMGREEAVVYPVNEQDKASLENVYEVSNIRATPKKLFELAAKGCRVHLARRGEAFGIMVPYTSLDRE